MGWSGKRKSFFFGFWYELSEFAYPILKITPFHGRLRRGRCAFRMMRKVWIAFVTGFSGRRFATCKFGAFSARAGVFRDFARRYARCVQNRWSFTSGNEARCKGRCNLHCVPVSIYSYLPRGSYPLIERSERMHIESRCISDLDDPHRARFFTAIVRATRVPLTIHRVFP